MEVEGIDFRATLELLARKAGVDLSMYDTKGSREIAQRKKRLLLAHELAANYYQQSLIKNPRAVDYVFKDRKLSKQVVQDFKIGYAPSSGDALTKFLDKKGFNKKELTQAGLVNRFGTDLFRGRMVIPLMDTTGQVVGFTGRIIIDDPKAPKYLNTPQTLIYDKGRHVFGLSQAKESIRTNDYAVIVEGNLDVVSSHQAGLKQVVATAGTAMTENHLKALVRLTNRVRLAFDADMAGLAATERAIPIAQSVGVDLSIITMPTGAKDPDELIKKDAKLWQKAIETAEPAVEWVLKQYAAREDLTTAIGKRRFTTAALDMVRVLQDSVEREYYVTKISKASDSSVEALKEKLLKGGGSKKEKILKNISNKSESAQDPAYYQDNLLAVALIDGATHDLFRAADIEIFTTEERRAVVKYLAEQGGKPVRDTPDELKNYDTYVKILLLKADARYADWNDSDRYFEAARLLRQVANEHKKKQKDILTEQLRDAETLGDESLAADIRAKLNKLIKEIKGGQR